MSGRFADATATATLILPGGCQCPGTPHEHDEWVYRTEPTGSDLSRARVEATARDGRVDLVLAQDVLMAALSVSWNLVGKEGEAVPLTRLAISTLDVETRNAMVLAVDPTAAGATRRRPAALSRNGSPGNGSRHPTPTAV